MTFPAPPVNPNTSAPLTIPQWCTGGNKVDPELTQDVITTGWQAVEGQNYGQIPPYQWVNWTQYQVGQFLNWIANPDPTYGALAYIKEGNFDGNIVASGTITSVLGGVIIQNNQGISFYNAGNEFYTLIANPNATSDVVYYLPPTYPTINNSSLVCSLGGFLTWNSIGQQIRSYTSISPAGVWATITSITLYTGTWDVSAVCNWTVPNSSLTLHIGLTQSIGNATPSDAVIGDNYVADELNGLGTLSIPSYRIVVTTNTICYLNSFPGGSAGVLYGRISAVKMG